MSEEETHEESLAKMLADSEVMDKKQSDMVYHCSKLLKEATKIDNLTKELWQSRENYILNSSWDFEFNMPSARKEDSECKSIDVESEFAEVLENDIFDMTTENFESRKNSLEDFLKTLEDLDDRANKLYDTMEIEEEEEEDKKEDEEEPKSPEILATLTDEVTKIRQQESIRKAKKKYTRLKSKRKHSSAHNSTEHQKKHHG